MKKYTVIALSVSGLRNKVHNSGEEVNENHFPPGRAEELKERGFLKYIGDSDEPLLDHTGQPEIFSKKDIGLYDITIGELMADLKAMNVTFPKNSSKAELFKIWKLKV